MVTIGNQSCELKDQVINLQNNLQTLKIIIKFLQHKKVLQIDSESSQKFLEVMTLELRKHLQGKRAQSSHDPLQQIDHTETASGLALLSVYTCVCVCVCGTPTTKLSDSMYIL